MELKITETLNELIGALQRIRAPNRQSAELLEVLRRELPRPVDERSSYNEDATRELLQNSLSALESKVASLGFREVRQELSELADEALRIEHGVPTADSAGEAQTVTVAITDGEGRPGGGATVKLHVCNDAATQLLEDRRWKTKVTGTMSGQPSHAGGVSTVTATAAIFDSEMVGQYLIFDTSGTAWPIEEYVATNQIKITGDASAEASGDTLRVSGTILSFLRFHYTIDDVDGVLIGEARDVNPFPVRLEQEDSGGGGEYDQWQEVEPDDAGGWQDKAGGRDHTITSLSVWETNEVTGIPAAASTGKVVWVHLEYGDEARFVFEYPGIEGVAIDAAAGPLEVEKWYDVIGNVAWTTFDSRDWRLRFADAAVWDMTGAPANNGARTIAATTQVWSYFSAGRVNVPADDWVETWIEATGGSASDQEIIYVNTGSGEFFVRCEESTGVLQYRVINWSANFNVRLKITAGRRILHSDAEQIGTPP